MKEYGGCLHFEILESIGQAKGGYYAAFQEHKVDVDCGRSAIQWILKDRSIKRIWLPVYNCPLVEKRIVDVSDVKIIWYNLSEDFLPQIDFGKLCKGDVILWINYYGIMPEKTIDKVASIQKETLARIIIDNIPAYFSKPRMDVLNIYSCRKFLGVPDGGHVIGNAVMCEELPVYQTSENFLYLLKAIESGSNSAYPDYQLSEKRFLRSKEIYGMPILTTRILEFVDYENVIAVRKKNFQRLEACLGKFNRLKINMETDTPSVYPFLTDDSDLRGRLLDNNIYISQFWKHVLSSEKANLFEKDLAKYLIPLPIDQRYGLSDMDIISDKVVRLLKDKRG